MRTRNLSWLFAVPVFFMACTGNKQQAMEMADAETISTDTLPSGRNIFYFNGDFTYYADAATLKDCVSGSTLPIAMKGEYLKVEKKYKEMDPKPKEAINCGVMGYLINKGSNEEGAKKQLLITGLVGFDKSASCTPSQRITDDIYAVFRPNEEQAKTKTSLTFDKDFTFQCVTYQLSPVKLLSEFKGDWYRTDKNLIVLLVNGDVLYQGTIDFTNMNLILENDQEKNVIFRRGI